MTNRESIDTTSAPHLPAPDFARYSQEQLEQILGRLDSVRYPERAREVRLRLAVLHAAALEATARAALQMGERKKISSAGPSSIAQLVQLSGAVFGLAFLAIIFLNEKQAPGWWPLVAVFVLAMARPFAGGGLMKEVFLMDDGLLLIRGNEQEIVPLLSIVGVDEVDADGMIVVLKLSRATKFGQKIVFWPAVPRVVFNPFRELGVVDELRASIASAKARAAR